MDRFGLNILLPFEERVNTVAALCERGYADRMILSHDANCFTDWFPPGDAATRSRRTGTSCTSSNDVLPALRERGVTRRADRPDARAHAAGLLRADVVGRYAVRRPVSAQLSQAQLRARRSSGRAHAIRHVLSLAVRNRARLSRSLRLPRSPTDRRARSGLRSAPCCWRDESPRRPRHGRGRSRQSPRSR